MKILTFFKVLSVFALTGVLITFSGCKTEENSEVVQSQQEYPRSETLYSGGFDWAPPATFNPLDYDPNFPIDGNVRLMYETLVTYNQLNGELEPMLADSFKQTDDAVIVHLDERAKWNNGEPVSVDDVIFSFFIDSILPTPRHGNWNYIKKISADSNNNITFSLNKENRNPLILLNAIAETSILPKKVFGPIVLSAVSNKTYDMAKVTAFKNDSNPVVSGPYDLKTFSPDKIVLERNDNYWGNVKHGGKKPAPKYIIHSLYNGNNHFNSAMVKGNLDVSSIFLPRIWDKVKDSIRAWSRNEPYHQPGSITTLLIAHHQKPFSDVAFRRALAHSINFEKVKARAISNYTPAMQSGFILPFGTESKFFNKDDAEKYGYEFDFDKARSILKDAGYSWNAEGALLNPDGSPVRTIKLECPQGWTDWEDAIKVIAGTFQEIGIPAEEYFVDYGVWDKDPSGSNLWARMPSPTRVVSATTRQINCWTRSPLSATKPN